MNRHFVAHVELVPCREGGFHLALFLLNKIMEIKYTQIHLNIFQQNLDESNIQLGPGGGTNRFSGWQRGSTGGGARNSVEQEKSNAPSNR